MMKNSVKLKGRLKSYLQSSLYLGFLLIAVDVLIYMIGDYRAGLILSGFIIFYEKSSPRVPFHPSKTIFCFPLPISGRLCYNFLIFFQAYQPIFPKPA